ncbi:MAG: nitroreductase family protein [Thiomicrorhabdus sp.]|nr:nitroreductase family protein [Thiomicrorhabdus sp.]
MNPNNLLHIIQSRRTCYQFLGKANHPVSLKAIQTCLEAAIYAPNHKLTQPWVFWLVSDALQVKLAHIYADNRALKSTQTVLENKESIYQGVYKKSFDKFIAIPSVVLVGQRLSNKELVCKEDYAACACAIQNFQLMAWSLKIGVQWSTGPIISDQRTYDLLTIKVQDIELIGALYLGHINESCLPNKLPKRKPVSEVMIEL